VVSPVRLSPPFGLAFLPTLWPGWLNSADHFPWHAELRGGDDDNTPAALALVERLMPTLPEGGLLEIGVALYDWGKTFTKRLLEGKRPEAVYLGVDIHDRQHVTRKAENAHCLRCSSFEQGRVLRRLGELGVDGLALLLVDGDHSLTGALNDWAYAELVVPGGVVLVHDTNSHPGPLALAAAIDRGVFDVEESLKDESDYGLLIARRK
jgi:hypothetical protein